jgi:quercetin dioxygenase-like cupin family protein
MHADDRFARRKIVLAPGARRPYHEAEWHDALVIVKRGEIDVECRAGGRLRFIAGDMLWFTGLPLRALRNPGPEPAVLVAIARRFMAQPKSPPAVPPA